MFDLITSLANDNNFQYSDQHGFKRDKSTETVLIERRDSILHQLDKGKHTLGLFLDLSRAFDTHDHNILLAKLEFYGFKKFALQLMHNK